ncbi:MAG: hypothetical protein AB7O66_05330 [Limisphaerales bacterium]
MRTPRRALVFLWLAMAWPSSHASPASDDLMAACRMLAFTDNVNHQAQSPRRYVLVGRLIRSGDAGLEALGKTIAETYILEDIDSHLELLSREGAMRGIQEFRYNVIRSISREAFGGDLGDSLRDLSEGAQRATALGQDPPGQKPAPVRFLERRRAANAALMLARDVAAREHASIPVGELPLRLSLRRVPQDISGRLVLDVRNVSQEALRDCIAFTDVRMDDALVDARERSLRGYGSIPSAAQVEVQRLSQLGIGALPELAPGKSIEVVLCNGAGLNAAAGGSFWFYSRNAKLENSDLTNLIRQFQAAAGRAIQLR